MSKEISNECPHRKVQRGLKNTKKIQEHGDKRERERERRSFQKD
jgi:hypothetical protein